MNLIFRILGFLLLGVLVLAGILVFRTMSYGPTSEIEEVELGDAPSSITADSAAQHLSEAIQFKTITFRAGDPTPGNEQPWLDLHAWLEETYPSAHAVMRKEMVADYTLLFTWEGTDRSLPPILFMAHQDVVPVNLGTESDWEGSPFAGEIKNGYVYGRGAIDDKGSLIGIMEAAEALAATGFEPQRTIYFLFGHDEEVSGSGAEAGIALLKSRGVNPEMALDEGFMVVNPSPLSNAPMGFIGIAEKGYLTLELTVSAQGGHSSTPPRDSAAVLLSKAIVSLDENQMPADFSKPPISDLFREAAADMPFTQKLAFANLWLFQGTVEAAMADIPTANAMIRTTTAPTMLEGSAKENVLAQRAKAIVNFRLHPNNNVEDVLAHVEEVTKDIPGMEIRIAGDSIGSEASPVSPTDNRVYAVLAAVAKEVGNGAPVAPGLVLGATDARYASAITNNVYRFMPAMMSPDELTGFHGTNERISVENMGVMSRSYARIMLTLAGE